MWFSEKKKTALVLSGGSARGLAHLGVIKVLKREGFKFDLVVGTSIGALCGATYCLGRSSEDIEKLALKTSITELVDVTISRMGLTEGNKLENVIRSAVDSKTFEDLKIPLVVTAVDVETGEEVCFTGGNLVKIIKASCALPGIYKPVEIGGRLLIDGGMKQHLPTEVAKRMGADFIVGVDVGFCVRKGKVRNMLAVIMQAVQIMGEELSRHQSSKADIIICPKLGDKIDQLSFSKAQFIMKKGEEAAEEALPLLRKHITRI